VTRSSVRFVSLSLFVLSLLAGCGGSDPDDPSIASPAGGAGSGGGSSQGGGGGSGAAGTSGPSRFASTVVSFTPGEGAGFGQDLMPDVVLGPPHGEGTGQGSLDVVSLGHGGEIVLGFEAAIVDGEGVDLIIFENAFLPGGDPEHPYKDLGEISISENGVDWIAFPCDVEHFMESSCAGWHPVYATPESGASTFDPLIAGGDPFDLAVIGVTKARYVKIRDVGATVAPPTAGFDLDAIAIVHAE
jgi:hypothetical protein